MNGKRFLLIGLPVLFWHCDQMGPTGPDDEVTIEILSDRFNPSSITIEPGTKVVWINRDAQTHSVDPGTFMNPTNDFVGSPNLDQDKTFTLTFTSLGTVNYYCSIHQASVKQGSIVVQQSGIY